MSKQNAIAAVYVVAFCCKLAVKYGRKYLSKINKQGLKNQDKENEIRMNVYENYVNERYAMSIEEMQKCHNLLAMEIQNDADAKELFEDVIDNATRYVNYRANWLLWKKEKQLEQDKGRSICHDALIVKFDVLARYLRSQGCTAEWREMLGNTSMDPVYRKRIGDFGCYLVFINCLMSR